MHLCKIPGIIKDLSIGNLFLVDSTVNWLGGGVWLYTHQQVPPSWIRAADDRYHISCEWETVIPAAQSMDKITFTLFFYLI